MQAGGRSQPAPAGSCRRPRRRRRRRPRRRTRSSASSAAAASRPRSSPSCACAPCIASRYPPSSSMQAGSCTRQAGGREGGQAGKDGGAGVAGGRPSGGEAAVRPWHAANTAARQHGALPGSRLSDHAACERAACASPGLPASARQPLAQHPAPTCGGGRATSTASCSRSSSRLTPRVSFSRSCCIAAAAVSAAASSSAGSGQDGQNGRVQVTGWGGGGGGRSRHRWRCMMMQDERQHHLSCLAGCTSPPPACSCASRCTRTTAAARACSAFCRAWCLARSVFCSRRLASKLRGAGAAAESLQVASGGRDLQAATGALPRAEDPLYP